MTKKKISMADAEIGTYAYKKVPYFKVKIENKTIKLILEKKIFDNLDDWEKINDIEINESNAIYVD